MDNDHLNIEEKLIPYLEGVLNPKERRVVDAAIQADGALAREMAELRELILVLREGFASGVKPPQDELSVAEVVELSSYPGSATVMPGTSQQKARLFCSDGVLEEYRLLRALQEDVERTTLDRENVPEMPAVLRREFQSLGKGPREVTPKRLKARENKLLLGWRRASSWVSRFSPRPLMGAAAALLILTLGIHFSQDSAPPLGESSGQVARNDSPTRHEQNSLAASVSPSGAPSAGVAATEASGIAVFTSDDRVLLKEQAEKLLSHKVRYTVTTDRILVAQSDVDQARKILWSSTAGTAVALADQESASGPGGAAMRVARDTGMSAGPRVEATTSEDEQPSQAVMYTAKGEVLPAPGFASTAQVTSAPTQGAAVAYYPPSASQAPAPPKAPSPTAPSHVVAAKASSASTQSQVATKAVSRQFKGPLKASKRIGASADLSRGREDAVPSAIKSEMQNLARQEKSEVDSDARREKLRSLALGQGAPQGPSVSAAPIPRPVPLNAAGVDSVAGVSSMAAPVPDEITLESSSAEAGDAPVEAHLDRVEKKMRDLGQRHDVELSAEIKEGHLVVYLRPKKTMTKLELDGVRKMLRKELHLVEADTIVVR